MKTTATINQKYEQCSKNLGRKPNANEFLVWSAARAKEYQAETGELVTANQKHTAEPNEGFELWLVKNFGTAGWNTASGDGSKEKMDLVEANIGLAVSCASKSKYNFGFNKVMPIEDLIQEGCLGLMDTVEAFDWSRSNTFSTYAYCHITQRINRALDNKSRIIRLPCHVTLATRKTGQTSQAVQAVSNIFSLDTPLKGHEETVFGDFIAWHGKDPSEDASFHLDFGMVGKALEGLTPKERQVIESRFGMGGKQAMTLEEVGSELGVTRERVRQIEAKALRRIRQSEYLPSRKEARELLAVA